MTQLFSPQQDGVSLGVGQGCRNFFKVILPAVVINRIKA